MPKKSTPPKPTASTTKSAAAKLAASSKTGAALSAADRKTIAAKFALTPAMLAAELAKSEKSAKKKTGGGRGGPALAAVGAWGEAAERKFYQDFPLGRFEGEPTLVWVKPDIFRLEPNPAAPFRFIRKSGEIVEPGHMFTDGGSIPRAFGVFSSNLSPWAYAPAFLVHDWLFDCHHAGTSDKSFEETRDIMLEGVKTLMESGVCVADRLAFDLIYSGIDSFVARRIWDGKK